MGVNAEQLHCTSVRKVHSMQTEQNKSHKKLPIKSYHFYSRMNILVTCQSMKRCLAQLVYPQEQLRGNTAVGCDMVMPQGNVVLSWGQIPALIDAVLKTKLLTFGERRSLRRLHTGFGTEAAPEGKRTQGGKIAGAKAQSWTASKLRKWTPGGQHIM